jgi:uncharacterized protein YneF (UPF0154 family)
MSLVLATWRDNLEAYPLTFLAGLMIGFWIGGRFTIRKHRDND